MWQETNLKTQNNVTMQYLHLAKLRGFQVPLIPACTPVPENTTADLTSGQASSSNLPLPSTQSHPIPPPPPSIPLSSSPRAPRPKLPTNTIAPTIPQSKQDVDQVSLRFRTEGEEGEGRKQADKKQSPNPDRERNRA